MARSHIFPSIRTSWLINVMLFIFIPHLFNSSQLVHSPKPHGSTSPTTAVSWSFRSARPVQFKHGQPVPVQYLAHTRDKPALTTSCYHLQSCPIPQPPTPPDWGGVLTLPIPTRSSLYSYHAPLPLLSDSTTHKHRKDIVHQNISLNKNTHTKHIVYQNISLTNTHKPKTYRPSEHLTQTKHRNKRQCPSGHLTH